MSAEINKHHKYDVDIIGNFSKEIEEIIDVSNKKAFIFDIGGVILNLDTTDNIKPAEAFSVMFDISPEEGYEIWKGDDYKKMQIGEKSPQQFLQNLKKNLPIEKSVDELMAEWIPLWSMKENCVDWELLKFIDELKKKYKVYIMSDGINLDQNNEITKKIKKQFDGCFVSYETGLKKSNPDSFLNVLNSIQLKPEECIFIDDTQKHLVLANQIGFVVVQYSGLDNFKKRLKNY